MVSEDKNFIGGIVIGIVITLLVMAVAKHLFPEKESKLDIPNNNIECVEGAK